MYKVLLSLLVLIIPLKCFCADLPLLCSPDKKVRVEISTSNGLSYSVFVDEKPVVLPSIIDLELSAGLKLGAGLKISSIKKHSVNAIINAAVPDKRKLIPDVYNELSITFKNKFGVIFRLYNDGFAYRITTNFKSDITVRSETAQFNFPQNAHAWTPIIHKRPGQDIYHTSFEELYPYKALDSLADTVYMYSPVLVALDGGIKAGVTESDLDDYPGMFLRGTGKSSLQATYAAYPLEERVEPGDFPQRVVTRRADYIAKTKGTRVFPWRALLISREDKDLPGNNLVYKLAEPCKLKDVSWIHPGKSTEEWIIDINLFNVPFKTGVNTATYKYYIDFAKRFGFDRIMMDAGWSDANDLFKISPNMNIDSIADYARSKGVKISMWTLAMTLDRQLDSALKQFNKWGADFIMTDFIDRDDQKIVNFYKRIAQACADAHIMIMFHGAYPPKGFNRTYPNNLTREGVLGSEYNAWSNKPTPEHNLTLPFTRMLAGPMDYEPGLLDNATHAQHTPIKGKVMSDGTRCQQLAMFVVYDSPLQMFSGNPSQGLLEPNFMDLLGSAPTTWDNTVILDAKVAGYIVTARKKGNDWFIAGMAGENAHDVNLRFDFLDDANYDAVICKDGVNADRYASDYVIINQLINKNQQLPVHMAPGGGFLIRLKKK